MGNRKGASEYLSISISDSHQHKQLKKGKTPLDAKKEKRMAGSKDACFWRVRQFSTGRSAGRRRISEGENIRQPKMGVCRELVR